MSIALRVKHAWLVLWELPQNLLGLGLLALLAPLDDLVLERFEHRLIIENRYVAVSLGWFVFTTRTTMAAFAHDDDTRLHELGHSIQSRVLGPAYLLLVGVPSVSRVAYAWLHWRFTGRRWQGYFDGWPENHADRLGGVQRRPRPTPHV